MFFSLETYANTFLQEIIQIFSMILAYFIGGFGYDYFVKHIILTMVGEEEYIQEEKVQKKMKVGLLTNEIPPIVYGGVATWIVNFLKMFEDDENIEVIPIFLAYNDKLPTECLLQYPTVLIIENEDDIRICFEDIDVCVNNLWIALETIVKIKELFPDMSIISVCHSLIRMENITNMGSCYTNNFNQQEITFQNSDYVVLISKAEEQYYNQFCYSFFWSVLFCNLKLNGVHQMW